MVNLFRILEDEQEFDMKYKQLFPPKLIDLISGLFTTMLILIFIQVMVQVIY